MFFSCAARLETHERDFSGVCGSVVEGSATRFKVPQLRRHIRFCKRGRAVHANSLSARRTTNWGLTGEQHDTNLTNWGKQPQSIAFNKALELLMLGWQGEGCFSKALPRRCKRAPRRSKTAPRCSFGSKPGPRRVRWRPQGDKRLLKPHLRPHLSLRHPADPPAPQPFFVKCLRQNTYVISKSQALLKTRMHMYVY